MSTTVRPAVPDDLPAITAIYNEAIRNGIGTFDLEEKTLAQQQIWFATHTARYPIIVASVDGNVTGWACLSPFSDRCGYANTAEVSLYIAPESRGNKLGTQLLAKLIGISLEIGFKNLVSRIAGGNEVSFRLHQRFEFRDMGKLEGVGEKFGKLLDVHYWQLKLT